MTTLLENVNKRGLLGCRKEDERTNYYVMVDVVDYFEKSDDPGYYQFKVDLKDQVFIGMEFIHDGKAFRVMTEPKAIVDVKWFTAHKRH